MKDEEWHHLEVLREEVDIATVLLSGQSFRWKKTDTEPPNLVGVFSNRLWVLKQTDDQIQYKAFSGNGDADCDKETLDGLLRNYFQLDVNLVKLYEQWAEKDSKFASLTMTEFKGIRILNQDPIENIFSFICSSNNNIQRISQMVEKLCLNYGRKILTYEGQDYYNFPEAGDLVGKSVEGELREESFGYRAGYIAKSAEKIEENGGRQWVEGLKKLTYNEARTELQKLTGIGRKVADCICLMSLGFSQAIPVDTHIHQLAKEYLPKLKSSKTLTDKMYAEITDHFRSIHGEYAGWAQSVLFASRLRHLKAEGSDSTAKKRKVDDDKNLPEDAKRVGKRNARV